MPPSPTAPRSPGAAPSGPPAVERRRPGREPVLIPATVVCEDGETFGCVLRDLSAAGARIGISREHRLPERFRLVARLRPEGFPVRLAWRKGDFAGLLLDLPRAGEAEGG